MGLHIFVAGLTGHEELAITDQEAQSLTLAGKNVARHYAGEQTQKAADWTALFIVLAGIYGTRGFAIQMKTKPSNISPFKVVQ